MKQLLKGVIPSSKVFKSIKKGQQSFRITKKMCDTIYNKCAKINNSAELILTLPCNEKEVYQVSCVIKKLNKI